MRFKNITQNIHRYLFGPDLKVMIEGTQAIESLQDGDKILIAEACTHHPIEDDIGRVKIPKWLKEYTKCDLQIEHSCGRDFPKNLSDYKLIVQCGACMLTRREVLFRMQKAQEAGVAITNYGVCISYLKGVLKRVTEVF